MVQILMILLDWAFLLFYILLTGNIIFLCFYEILKGVNALHFDTKEHCYVNYSNAPEKLTFTDNTLLRNVKHIPFKGLVKVDLITIYIK